MVPQTGLDTLRVKTDPTEVRKGGVLLQMKKLDPEKQHLRAWQPAPDMWGLEPTSPLLFLMVTRLLIKPEIHTLLTGTAHGCRNRAFHFSLCFKISESSPILAPICPEGRE